MQITKTQLKALIKEVFSDNSGIIDHKSRVQKTFLRAAEACGRVLMEQTYSYTRDIKPELDRLGLSSKINEANKHVKAAQAIFRSLALEIKEDANEVQNED